MIARPFLECARKLFAAAAILAGGASCSGPMPVGEASSALPPSSWPSIVRAPSGCPILDGFYRSMGAFTRFIYDDITEPRREEGNEIPSFFFRGGAAKRANLADREQVPSWWRSSDGDVLRILQADDSLLVEAVITAPEVVYHGRLQYGRDFTCEAGTMLMKPIHSDGYTDGAQHRFEVQETVGKLADGSIYTYRKSYASATAFFLITAKRRTETFNRLLPVTLGK